MAKVVKFGKNYAVKTPSGRIIKKSISPTKQGAKRSVKGKVDG